MNSDNQILNTIRPWILEATGIWPWFLADGVDTLAAESIHREVERLIGRTDLLVEQVIEKAKADYSWPHARFASMNCPTPAAFVKYTVGNGPSDWVYNHTTALLDWDKRNQVSTTPYYSKQINEERRRAVWALVVLARNSLCVLAWREAMPRATAAVVAHAADNKDKGIIGLDWPAWEGTFAIFKEITEKVCKGHPLPPFEASAA